MTISKEQIELLIQSWLIEQFPDLDLSKLSNIYDLVVKPLASSIERVYQDIEKIKSVIKLDVQSNLLTEEEKEELFGKLFENLFVGPSAGTKARGQAIVYVFEKKNYSVPSDLTITTTDGLVYELDSDSNMMVLEDELEEQLGPLGTISRYWFYIPIIAQREGSSYNVEAGQEKRAAGWSSFDSSVIAIDIVSASGGSDRENLSSYISRLGNIFIGNVFATESGIIRVFESNFPELTGNVYIAGKNSCEMIRDNGKGGCIDIYVRGPVRRVVENLVIGSSRTVTSDRLFVFKVPVVVSPDPTKSSPLYLHLYDIFGYDHLYYEVEQIYGNYILIKDPYAFPSTKSHVKWALGYYDKPDENQAFTDLYNEALENSSLYGDIVNEFALENSVILNYSGVVAIESVLLHLPSGQVQEVLRGDSGGYQVKHTNLSESGSTKDLCYLEFDPAYAGYTVTITYWANYKVKDYTDFLNSYGGRLLSIDYLLRSGYPVLLELELGVEGDVDTKSIKAAVVDYVNSQGIGKMFSFDGLASNLRSSYSSLRSVELRSLRYSIELPDGKQVVFSNTQKVVIPSSEEEFNIYLDSSSAVTDFVLLKYGITTNNCFCFIYEDNVTIY